jgi:hypothetical protein
MDGILLNLFSCALTTNATEHPPPQNSREFDGDPGDDRVASVRALRRLVGVDFGCKAGVANSTKHALHNQQNPHIDVHSMSIRSEIPQIRSHCRIG